MVRDFLTAGLPRLQEHLRPLEAWLFGSRARGDWMEYSDLDILLVSPAFEGLPWPQRGVEAMRILGRPFRGEYLCYTPEEFKRKQGEIGIVAEALREGVRLA